MSEDAIPLALVVRFTLRNGAEAAFDALVAEMAANIREREPGTLVYSCHRVVDKPLERIFYELYANRVAFEAHEASAYIRRFVDERAALVESIGVDFLRLEDGKTPYSLRVAAIVAGTERVLQRGKERAHLIRALLTAIDRNEAVRTLLAASDSAAAAESAIMDLLGIDQAQVRVVLDMQHRKLAALERRELANECETLIAQIADYESILASPELQHAMVGTERGDLLEKYGAANGAELSDKIAR